MKTVSNLSILLDVFQCSVRKRHASPQLIGRVRLCMHYHPAHPSERIHVRPTGITQKNQ
jgi:hypothetical protein